MRKALSIEFRVLVIPYRDGSTTYLEASDLPFFEGFLPIVDDTKRHTRDRRAHFHERVLILDGFKRAAIRKGHAGTSLRHAPRRMHGIRAQAVFRKKVQEFS